MSQDDTAGAGIDAFYERKRVERNRESATLADMVKDGASREDILRQEQLVIDAGNTGD